MSGVTIISYPWILWDSSAVKATSFLLELVWKVLCALWARRSWTQWEAHQKIYWCLFQNSLTVSIFWYLLLCSHGLQRLFCDLLGEQVTEMHCPPFNQLMGNLPMISYGQAHDQGFGFGPNQSNLSFIPLSLNKPPSSHTYYLLPALFKHCGMWPWSWCLLSYRNLPWLRLNLSYNCHPLSR